MGCAQMEIEVLRTDVTVDVEFQTGSIDYDILTNPVTVDVELMNNAELLAEVQAVPVTMDIEYAQGSIDISFVCDIDISGETIYYLADKNNIPILTIDGNRLFLRTED